MRRIDNGFVEPFPADCGSRGRAEIRRGSDLVMLDKMQKTLDLIAAMKTAVPFEVELTPPLIARLRTEPTGRASRRGRSRVKSYAGDEGGILCHIEPEGRGKRLLVSLTHLTVRQRVPFTAAALEYQKRRSRSSESNKGRVERKLTCYAVEHTRLSFHESEIRLRE